MYIYTRLHIYIISLKKTSKVYHFKSFIATNNLKYIYTYMDFNPQPYSNLHQYVISTWFRTPFFGHRCASQVATLKTWPRHNRGLLLFVDGVFFLMCAADGFCCIPKWKSPFFGESVMFLRPSTMNIISIWGSSHDLRYHWWLEIDALLIGEVFSSCCVTKNVKSSPIRKIAKITKIASEL